MPRSRDLLNRFRPTGTPGAAGAAGVPVDHDAGSAAELAPVLAALAATESACDALVAEARARAARVRDAAQVQAQELLADTRGRLGAEQAAVVARARERRAGESAVELRAAELRAAEVRSAAEERRAGCVAEVVAAVRVRLGAAP